MQAKGGRWRHALLEMPCFTWEMHENREYAIMTGKDSLFFGARTETGLTQIVMGFMRIDEKMDFLPIMQHTGELILRVT